MTTEQPTVPLTPPSTKQAMLYQLRQDFPRCFVASTHKRPKPIDRGINKKLCDHYRSKFGETFALSPLKAALKYYVNGYYYLKAFSTATHRIDLNGDDIVPISDSERLYAKERFDKLHNRQKAAPMKKNKAKPIPAPETTPSQAPQSTSRPRLSLRKSVAGADAKTTPHQD